MLNFNGPDWTVFEQWLADQQYDTYRRLANPNCDIDETNQLRGRALFIDQLLDLRNNPAATDKPLLKI